MLVNIGKGIELECPRFEEFTADIQNHIVYIGLRNILMDSHAGVTAAAVGDGPDGDAEFRARALSRAVAEKKLAALVAGELRTTSARETDPVRAEAVKLAVGAIERKIRAAGKKVSDYDRKDIRDKALSILDKFMDQARKNVEAAKAIEVEIEI
jgi:hypothetical protein